MQSNIEKYTLEEAQNLIESLSNNLPEEIKRALVVRFTNKTNMFGETYEDTISQSVKDHELRSSVQVHPYPWLTVGSSNVIIRINSLNEIEVVLVYNQRRDRRSKTDPLRIAGVPDYFKLPEGYMHPRPCKGGERGISLVSSEQMDEAEQLMLKNISMNEAYKTIKASKLCTAESQPSGEFDNTTKDCAIREGFEEVGLKASIQEVHYVAQLETNRLVPNINYVYLIKAKQQSYNPPELKVDGVEIKEALWGKLKAFRFAKDDFKPEKVQVTLDYYDGEGTRHDIEVPIKFALMIGQAIQKFRTEEIQKNSAIEGYSLFNSRVNIEARIKQILNIQALNPQKRTLEDVLGYAPEHYLKNLGVCNLAGDTEQEVNNNLEALSNLGKEADEYHKKCIVLAKAFKRGFLDKPFSAEQLIEIAQVGSKIEANYYQNKTRLFPLARLSKSDREDNTSFDLNFLPMSLLRKI